MGGCQAVVTIGFCGISTITELFLNMQHVALCITGALYQRAMKRRYFLVYRWGFGHKQFSALCYSPFASEQSPSTFSDKQLGQILVTDKSHLCAIVWDFQDRTQLKQTVALHGLEIGSLAKLGEVRTVFADKCNRAADGFVAPAGESNAYLCIGMIKQITMQG